MNYTRKRRSSFPSLPLAIALGLLIFVTPANSQSSPPDWWASNDNDTVSLAYLFSASTWPPQADMQIAPGWFGGATWSVSGTKPLLWVPTFLGHNGVVGFFDAQPGEAKLHLVIDNDPRPEWTKQVWYQFDLYQVKSELQVTLAAETPAEASNATETVEGLESGWKRITGSFELAPQPGWEELTWTIAFQCTGYAAFDNVYVGTHCTAAPNVPEPTTLVTLLLACGGASLAIKRRRG